MQPEAVAARTYEPAGMLKRDLAATGEGQGFVQVQMLTCSECHALVSDTDSHDGWHTWMEAEAAAGKAAIETRVEAIERLPAVALGKSKGP